MWRRILVSTLALVVVGGLPGIAVAQPPTLMIGNVTTRFTIGRAIDGARRRLEAPRCQGVLDEFADASGASLRTVLDQANVTPAEFLVRLRFADGDQSRQCQKSGDMAAFTMPGNRVVFICARRFDTDFRDRMMTAEMIIIHEMLHAVGLGENPPASREITARVTKRCGA
ncbi:MAG TPA: hypothetical protein VF219_01605 [Vicinamibacterales bacterium]